MIKEYYTPSIDEFDKELEYEIVGWIKPDNKEIFLSKDNKRLIDAIENKSIRVKMLDKEDIEELGFVAEHTYTNGDGIYRKGAYTLRFMKHSGINVIINKMCGAEVQEVYFRGYCKNKAELKNIVKQVCF